MRKFVLRSLTMMIALALLIGYQQNVFFGSEIPYDEEQVGLREQVTIKFSHVVAENTPKGQAALHFAKLIEQKSNGTMRVHVFPNGSLYNDETEFEALLNGQVQMLAPTTSKITQYLPNWQLLDLPFLIENEEQLKKALTGKTADRLLDELKKYNIHGLAFWSNGFKHMTSLSDPLIQPSDFTNLKIRTMASELLELQFTLLGAKPLPSSFADVYGDLAQNNIDAQENTVSNIYTKGFYTVQNHLTLSHHGVLNYAVLMNEDFWDTLSPEQQQIIEDAIDETNEWQFNQSLIMNKKSLEELVQSDLIEIHTLSVEELAKWKEQLEPIYDYYQKNIHPTYLQQLLNELNSD